MLKNDSLDFRLIICKELKLIIILCASFFFSINIDFGKTFCLLECDLLRSTKVNLIVLMGLISSEIYEIFVFLK